MAKKSSIEKNKRRMKLSKQYAGRRERLLAIANDDSKSMEERFTARLKLAEVPRNANPTRIRNRCEISGRPRAVYRKLKMSRIALRDLGSKGLIPGLTNDPVGDMLTRIRNAQMRRKSKVTTPGSRLRSRVLDVLQSEGYIRGYTTSDLGNGRTEFDIELKYFEGEPVIRTIERVSKPGRRVYVAVTAMPRVANGLGITILSTPKGVMADHTAREQNVGGEVLCTVF